MEEQTITAVKVDEFTIQITETKQPVVTVKEYDINFLVSQLKSIQASKDAFNAARDAEIAEINALLQHCEEHNVIAKPEVLTEEPINIQDV